MRFLRQYISLSNPKVGFLIISLLYFLTYETMCLMSADITKEGFFSSYFPVILYDIVESFIIGVCVLWSIQFFLKKSERFSGNLTRLIYIVFFQLLFNFVIGLILSSIKNSFLGLGMPMVRIIYVSLGITMVLTLVMSIYLIVRLSLEYIKARDMQQKEHELSIVARINALQYQINPHFLFNNLNTLSQLIDEDKDLANEYLRHMALVFRHTLQNENRCVIPLHEELENLNSYLFLIKFRFGDRISIEISPELHSSSIGIAKDSLMLLVENAIKHNKTSAHQPLQIRIFQEGDFIAVSNDYRPIKTGFFSTKKGMKNIVERYSLLKSDLVKCDVTDNLYVVKLPKLKPFAYENCYN